MKAYIDGDGLLYRAAYATQESWYEVYVRGTTKIFNGKHGLSDAKALCHELRIPYERIEHRTSAQAEGHAVYVLDTMVKGLLKTLKTDGHAAESIVIGDADSSGNFRYKFNPAYKANRPPKPLNYGAVRERLLSRWGAEVSEPEFETDDIIAMDCDKGRGLIVSQDKDFMQVDADIYNWVKEEYYNVADRDPELELCIQLLTGDATDNIQTGLYRYSHRNILTVHECRSEEKPMPYTKIAKLLGCTAGMAKTLSLLHPNDYPVGYGDIGPAIAKKILRGGGKEAYYLEIVADLYADIFGSDWPERLNTVGQQVYLLRGHLDNFKYKVEGVI